MRNSENAQATDGMATQSAKEAVEGGEAVVKTVSAMKQIAANEPHKATHSAVTTPWALSIIVPHNTAVLTEKPGGKDWIVDMWTVGYGQVPDVMTLEKWMDEP